MGFWSKLFGKKDFDKKQPHHYVHWREPQPGEVPEPSISDAAIKVIWSADRRRYGEVTQHSPGVYKSACFELFYIDRTDEFVWTILSSPFNSYFDSPEKAAEDAEDLIKTAPRF